MNDLRALVAELVDNERDRQDAKWGSQRHHAPTFWLTILAEEFGEVANAILERKDRADLTGELVQVAAVAQCWAEALVAQTRAAPPDPDL